MGQLTTIANNIVGLTGSGHVQTTCLPQSCITSPITSSGVLTTGSITLPHTGMGGLYSVGSGTAYTYHGLDIGLLDRPRNLLDDADDTLYPVNMRQDSAFVRFHLQVWRESLSMPREDFWKIMDSSGDGKSGFPTFRSKSARNDFNRWWKSYGRFFDNAGDQTSCFLPTLIPGKVSGKFVEHKTFVDNMPHSMLRETFGDGRQIEKGLLQILPAWVWIVNNCKSRVYKIHNGWLFTRHRDATLFPMFAPWPNIDS